MVLKNYFYLLLMLYGASAHGEVKKYILTGGAGVGKTSIINYLEAELKQHVVREAATDLIALDLSLGIDQPYIQKGFNDRVVKLQTLRQERVEHIQDGSIFFDRSPVDVVVYEELAGSISDQVSKSAKEASEYYEKTVFLIESLNKSCQTAIRAENLEQSRELERLQIENYKKRGFKLIKIGPGSVKERAEQILNLVQVLIKCSD